MIDRLEWAETSPASGHCLMLAHRRQLITLWDLMREFDSGYFFSLSRTLERLSTQLANMEHKDIPLPGKFRQFALEETAKIRTRSIPLGLRLSLTYLDRMDVNLSNEEDETTGRQFAHILTELSMRIMDELKLTTVLNVPRERASYYLQKDAFGATVSRCFPSAVNDVEEASTCYALGRYTACVFHLMRTMEAGLQELGTVLGVTFANEKVWQNILDEVNKQIKALALKHPKRAILSRVATNLYNVKLAWRNEVMHPKGAYTEDEALRVHEAVKWFMTELGDAVT